MCCAHYYLNTFLIVDALLHRPPIPVNICLGIHRSSGALHSSLLPSIQRTVLMLMLMLHSAIPHTCVLRERLAATLTHTTNGASELFGGPK
jgi:hypothetical protein